MERSHDARVAPRCPVVNHDLHPWHLRALAAALAVLAALALLLLDGCAALSTALVGDVQQIKWDAGTGATHVRCRDTESVVRLPGGQVLTITHERGRGLCDAVEAMRATPKAGAKP